MGAAVSAACSTRAKSGLVSSWVRSPVRTQNGGSVPTRTVTLLGADRTLTPVTAAGVDGAAACGVVPSGGGWSVVAAGGEVPSMVTAVGEVRFVLAAAGAVFLD